MRPSNLVAAAAAFAGSASAEMVYLNNFEIPPPKTLEIVYYFTILGKDAGESIVYPTEGDINWTDELKSNEVQLALIADSDFDSIDKTHFCCSYTDLEANTCKHENTLIIPPDAVGTHAWTLSKEKEDDTFYKAKEGPMSVDVAGMYYLAVVNCGYDSPPEGTKFMGGEMIQASSYGYLPAEEKPKLAFYGFLVLAYVAVGVFWFVICSRWKDVLFTVHHFISAAIYVGLVEALCWYTALTHWNTMGHRWRFMVHFAAFGTVFKQTVSYMLLLAVSIGWGVTKPTLESSTLRKIVALGVSFFASDYMRQVVIGLPSAAAGAEPPLSAGEILLIVGPGSVVLSVFFCWIMNALQETIEELSANNQKAKLAVFHSLRGMLIGTAVVLVVIIVYESAIVRQTDLSVNWRSKWFFTDGISHLVFLANMTGIMLLWRPSERSKDYAFSVQMAADGTVIGDPEQPEGVDVDLDDEPEDDEFSFKKGVDAAKRDIEMVSKPGE